MLDLESVEKRIQSTEKKAKGGDRESKELLESLRKVYEPLAKGLPARSIIKNKDDEKEKSGRNCGVSFTDLLFLCCRV